MASRSTCSSGTRRGRTATSTSVCVDGNEWIYRRDPRARLPLARVVRRRDDGLPYVDPAVQLLWKAKDPRPQDELDFATVTPLLSRDERRWLAGAIGLAHPESPWVTRLSER